MAEPEALVSTSMPIGDAFIEKFNDPALSSFETRAARPVESSWWRRALLLHDQAACESTLDRLVEAIRVVSNSPLEVERREPCVCRCLNCRRHCRWEIHKPRSTWHTPDSVL